MSEINSFASATTSLMESSTSSWHVLFHRFSLYSVHTRAHTRLLPLSFALFYKMVVEYIVSFVQLSSHSVKRHCAVSVYISSDTLSSSLLLLMPYQFTWAFPAPWCCETQIRQCLLKQLLSIKLLVSMINTNNYLWIILVFVIPTGQNGTSAYTWLILVASIHFCAWFYLLYLLL